MTGYSKEGGGLVADLVDDETEKNDAKREGPKSHSENLSDLGLRELKFFAETSNKRRADPKNKSLICEESLVSVHLDTSVHT